MLFLSMEKYSRGRRGAPAKGVGRETGARVQIPPSPPRKQVSKDACFFDEKNKELNPSAEARGGRLRLRPEDDERSKKEWQEHIEFEHSLCEE